MIAIAGLIVIVAGLLGAGIAAWLEPHVQRPSGSRISIAIEVGIAWLGIVALVCLVCIPFAIPIVDTLPLLVPAVLGAAALCYVRSARYATSAWYGPFLFSAPSIAFGLLHVNGALAKMQPGAYFPWFIAGPVLFAVALVGHLFGLRRRRTRMVAP